MNAPRLDPFAFARVESDGDAEILTLFRQWIAEHRAAQQIGKGIENEGEFTAAIMGICGIEHEIADIPVTGPVGFAVKAYLACHYEHSPRWGDDPAGVTLVTRDQILDAGETPDSYASLHCIAAVIRDAARFVPEIAELAGPVINPAPSAVAAETARVLREITAMGARS